MTTVYTGKLPEDFEDGLKKKELSLNGRILKELQRKKNIKEYALSVYAYAEVFDRACGYLGIGRDSIVIEKDERGKPYISGSDDLFFSISHSFPFYAAAFSSGPVGVDIEKIRDVKTGIAKRMFTERERQYAGNDPVRFLEIWTRKEAYLKYTGKGIFGGSVSADVLSSPICDSIFSRTNGETVLSVCSEDKAEDIGIIPINNKYTGGLFMSRTAIDISHIPFSRYGAYVAIVATPANEERTLFKELTFYHSKLRFEKSPVYTLRVGTGPYSDFECTSDPTHITIRTEQGSAILYIKDDESIVIDSNGLDFRLDPVIRWIYGNQYGENEFRLIIHDVNLYGSVYVLDGKAEMLDDPESDRIMKKDMELKCVDGRFRCCLTMAIREPKDMPYAICAEKDLAEIGKEWEVFLEQMTVPAASDKITADFTELTWFNMWSCFVRAQGVYKKDTMLMSKKFMSSVWSWDHCFNALAMAKCKDRKYAKEKAFDQFCAPFWLQTEKGILPDMWNPDNWTKWGTTKPPIHGWCFSKLMDQLEFSEDELKTVYVWLKKWTEWWILYSDSDKDGIPDYPMGCDSGWDNGTLFDLGYFVETPDLPAFLILQMKTLARISRELKDGETAASWDRRAKELLDRFIEHSWNGERFVAKISRTHEHEEKPTCLLSLIPLILGDILPKDIFDKLVDVLEKDFLTDNGPATEMPAGKKYESDGYWRGPIWAPSTYLITDGLNRGGRKELAKTIAGRYCRMSSERAHGNYENFDALTGKGLRAPGYTWSSSVYMLLREEYGV